MRSFDWIIKHMVCIQQKEEHQINARFLESISSYIGIFSDLFIATSKMTNMKYYPCQGKIIPFVLFWETIELLCLSVSWSIFFVVTYLILIHHLKTLFSGIGLENSTFATKMKISLVRTKQKVCLCYVSKLKKWVHINKNIVDHILFWINGI